MNTYSIYNILYVYIHIYINTDTYIYTWQTVASSMPSKSIKLCNKVKKGPWGTVEPGNTIFKECWQQGNNKCCVEAPGIQLHLFLSYFFYCPVYLSRWIDQIIHLSIYLPPNLSPTLRSGHNRYWPWLLHHRWWHYLADSAVKKKTRRMKHYTAPMRANQRKR